jgi:hypothetical protein
MIKRHDKGYRAATADVGQRADDDFGRSGPVGATLNVWVTSHSRAASSRVKYPRWLKSSIS